MPRTEKPMMTPVHPGELLKEDFLDPLGIRQYRLAQAIGVPPRQINEIVHETRRISADTALRLARYFGMSDGFWMNLQGRYDIEVEKDRLGATLAEIRAVFQLIAGLAAVGSQRSTPLFQGASARGPAGGRAGRIPAMPGKSRGPATLLVGRWRIVEMERWCQEDVDLVAAGFIEFERGHMGSLGFIAVQGGVDWRGAPRDGRPGVEFSWEGFDEGDSATGRGWAVVEEDGSLRGRIFVHLGDDSGFSAERDGIAP